MNKEFVTYQQALALKKLGFDGPCLAFYSPKEELHPVFQEPSKGPYFNNGSFIETLRAPLYQQAFRWFREKHNLCGEVYTVNMGAIDYTFQIRDLYSEDIKHDNFEAYTGGYTGTFLTYEESESACLDKLIEICKTKTNE
jgi:hypothetical protein